MRCRRCRSIGWGRMGLVLLCAVAGAAAGMGLYTFYYAEGLSYMSDDPEVCINCHIMRDQYDGWLKAGHHAHATCNDCHLPHDFLGKYLAKAQNGYHHSKAFTLNDFHEPIMIRQVNKDVLQANCRTCHAALVSEITGHARSRYDDLGCVHCHRSVGHGP